jgi:carbohydrate-selective porin OprB
VVAETRDANRFAAFLRPGFSPRDERNEVEWPFDAGLTWKGLAAEDRIGLAITHVRFSDAFVAGQVAGGTPVTDAETVMKATYQCSLSPWSTLQPTVQHVSHPQVAQADNALVAGVRLKLIL